jgi:hypothetical protein
MIKTADLSKQECFDDWSFPRRVAAETRHSNRVVVVLARLSIASMMAAKKGSTMLGTAMPSTDALPSRIVLGEHVRTKLRFAHCLAHTLPDCVGDVCSFLNTRETVFALTPARSATSCIVTRAGLPFLKLIAVASADSRPALGKERGPR